MTPCELDWTSNIRKSSIYQQQYQQHVFELAWIHLVLNEPLNLVISVDLSDYELVWMRLNLMKNEEGVR